MSKKSAVPEMSEAQLRALKPSACAAAAGATLIAAMAFGAWQMVGALQAELDYPQTMTDFREGRTTQTLEKQIDKKLPTRADLIAFANSLRYKLMHGGGDQVRIGTDDWLYLTDEVRFYPHAEANQTARINLLVNVAKALDKQGVKLVVALVPDKARIYPQHLADGHLPVYTQGRYAQALLSLRQQGVRTVDLIAPLAGAANAADPTNQTDQNKQVYYRTDTHWNNQGAQLAAQAIAAVAKGSNAGLSDLEPTDFATQPSGPEAERPGDLLRLMGLSNVSNFWRPQPDREIPITTRQTSVDKEAGGLLDDTAALPVTLIGTSYSLRGNFLGHLQQALSAKVLNTAKDGGGFLQAATDYFKNDAFKNSKPKLVVWELPERFLAAPLENEAGWLKDVGLAP